MPRPEWEDVGWVSKVLEYQGRRSEGNQVVIVVDGRSGDAMCGEELGSFRPIEVKKEWTLILYSTLYQLERISVPYSLVHRLLPLREP